MIEQFSTKVCPLDVEKFKIFAVYVHFLSECFQEGSISISQTSLVFIVFKLTVLSWSWWNFLFCDLIFENHNNIAFFSISICLLESLNGIWRTDKNDKKITIIFRKPFLGAFKRKTSRCSQRNGIHLSIFLVTCFLINDKIFK